ncbi:MAG: four helix bundle protein [Saprospiraceae bacterium]
MNKEEFVEAFRARTKTFAVDVVKLFSSIPNHPALSVIRFQIFKSATSTAANYRAACRARSQAEFHAKMSIVVEEADETQFWLEVVESAGVFSGEELTRLQNEALEIVKVCSKARSNAASE